LGVKAFIITMDLPATNDPKNDLDSNVLPEPFHRAGLQRRPSLWFTIQFRQ